MDQTTRTHVGEVTEYQRTEWGGKGLVRTGACEIPFLVPIRLSYMADAISVGSVIEYGKDSSGSIRLPIVYGLVPPVSDQVPYLNEEEVKPLMALKDMVELMLAGMTAHQAKMRELLQQMPVY